MNGCKTNLVHFRFVRRSTADHSDLVVDGIAVESVSAVKYLGLSSDFSLGWKDHISAFCKKLSCVVGILRRPRNYLPTRVLFTMIFFIGYLTGICSSDNKGSLMAPQILQNISLSSGGSRLFNSN